MRRAFPFIAAAAVGGLLILAFGLVPTYVVPWQRVSIVLEDHREHFALVGGMALLGAGIFLVLTLFSY
jgi:hypothetical protein